MSENRGKDFEGVIKKAFEAVENTSVIRLPDPVQGYLGYRNICDFIVYHYPFQYFIECKSVHGNTFPIRNVTDNQRIGMFEQSKKEGIIAGVICWWIDKDITKFISIEELVIARENGYKSIRYDHEPFTQDGFIDILAKKKRVFFDYDMESFFVQMQYS